MELKVKQITFPEAIEFNFSELKQEIEERTASYVGLVYSEDQIKDAKKDAAMLRKFTKALSDERIRVKKDLMKPYEEFEGKIKELTGIVDKAIGEIDVQIKAYEDKKKQEKLDEITLYFNNTEHPDWLHLSQIMDEKWMNASVSMKSVQDAIDARLDKIGIDLTTLANLPEFGFEAQQVYIHSLDINKALAEGQRMAQIAKAKAEREEAMRKIEEEQKAKAEAAVAQEEQIPGQIEFTDTKSFKECMNPPVEPAKQKQWVSFQAFLSTEDALALRAFFNSRNIEFKAV